MLGHYKTLLAGLVGAPERAVAELPLLTAPERTQILGGWSAGALPDAPLRHACIHGAFEAQVDATPDAIALHYDAGDGAPPLVWTYRELDQRANAVAHRLARAGRRTRAAGRTLLRTLARDDRGDPGYAEGRGRVYPARPCGAARTPCPDPGRCPTRRLPHAHGGTAGLSGAGAGSRACRCPRASSTWAGRSPRVERRPP